MLLGLFAGMQFFRPERLNPAVEPGRGLASAYVVPDAVNHALERACADCHSQRTHWPWYSHIAPASWLVASHVHDGRRRMNIDNWDEETSFRDICREVSTHSMPPRDYLALHWNARLSPSETAAICAWTERPEPR